MKIIDVEGIGPAYAAKMKAAGIRTTDALLKEGATPEGRRQIAERAGVGHESILEWVNRADLFRIKGVGSQYSDLLENAGVDTVVELSKRVSDNLYAKMVEVNLAKNLVNKLPSEKQVQRWIEQAKKLPRVVSY